MRSQERSSGFELNLKRTVAHKPDPGVAAKSREGIVIVGELANLEPLVAELQLHSEQDTMEHEAPTISMIQGITESQRSTNMRYDAS